MTLASVYDHLWQSTAFAAAAGLFTLALRNNRARVRHGLWLAASIKFAIPLAMLIGLGNQIQIQIRMSSERRDRRQARVEFSSSLLKIASGRLVDDAQLFQKVITKIKTWYNDESRNLTVEISSRKMDAFFTDLATELGVDFDGPTPFTARSIDWRTESAGSRSANV